MSLHIRTGKAFSGLSVDERSRLSHVMGVIESAQKEDGPFSFEEILNMPGIYRKRESQSAIIVTESRKAFFIGRTRSFPIDTTKVDHMHQSQYDKLLLDIPDVLEKVLPCPRK